MPINNVQVTNNIIPQVQTPRTAFRGATVPDYPSDSVEIGGKKKTGMSNGAKVGFGVGILAAIGVAAALIRKRNVKEAVQLAEHIDFTEAKTLDEAIKWGKQHFGIKNYRGFEEQDLDVLNWINEGLTNVNNKMKGKWKTPSQIQFRERDDINTLATMISNATGKLAKWNGFFEVNKKAFRNLDTKTNKLISALEKGDIITVNGNKFTYCNWFSGEDIQPLAKNIMLHKQGKITTFKDKVKLYESLCNLEDEIYSINEAPYSKIKQILKHENIATILKNKGVETDLEKIKVMTIDEQNKLVSSIMDKAENKIYFGHTQGDVFRTIYHEIGHLQDNVNRVAATGKFKNPKEYPKELQDWLNNDEYIQTASRISEYSTSGPGEFIAETFAEMISGKRDIPKDVMALYKKLNGPMIN